MNIRSHTEVETHNNKDKLNYLPLVALISFLLMAAAYGIYFGVIEKLDPGGPGSWGEFGDFIGGVLNPLIGVASIYLIIKTLKSQQEELRLQRNEIAESNKTQRDQHEAFVIQSINDNFFNWIEIYNTNIRKISIQTGKYTDRQKTHSGISAINEIIKIMELDHFNAKGFLEHLENQPPKNQVAEIKNHINQSIVRYKNASEYNIDNAESLLRIAESFLFWIDSNKFIQHEEKYQYVKQFTAGLNQTELKYLLLRYIHEEDQHQHADLKTRIEKYKFFMHLNPIANENCYLILRFSATNLDDSAFSEDHLREIRKN